MRGKKDLAQLPEFVVAQGTGQFVVEGVLLKSLIPKPVRKKEQNQDIGGISGLRPVAHKFLVGQLCVIILI